MAQELKRKARALVVVGKSPVPGSVKTRLCPPLTPLQAAEFYECLLQDIVTKMRSYREADFWIAFAPEGQEYFRRHYPETRLLSQRGKDLGERLHYIFVDLFRMGYHQIVVADSDSLTVPLANIRRAFESLSEGTSDVVYGPCDDGGYYLIGLKKPRAKLFESIPWSTDGVLVKTMERAAEMELDQTLLARAYDIDLGRDLKKLWKDFETLPDLRGLAPRTYAYLTWLFDEQSRIADA